MQNKIDTKAL